MVIKEALLPTEINKVKDFLNKFDLKYEQDIDYTVYIEDKNEVIATVSTAHNIIKSFAISNEYQGFNLANKLLSHIISYFNTRNIHHYMVYTDPDNVEVFKSLNFNLIVSSNDVALLENRTSTITEKLRLIKQQLNINSADIASIVINANPLTNGHLYLIQQASLKHDKVIVFVVEEDKSVFSFDDRFAIVKEAVQELANVIVAPSTKYIVSSLTFPTYFLKKDVDEVRAQAEIDALIFKQYFMPILGIKTRYVGTETDLVTNKYNEELTKILKEDLVIIERISHKNKTISATMIRNLLADGDVNKTKEFVPPATYNYLLSAKGKEMIRKLSKDVSR